MRSVIISLCFALASPAVPAAGAAELPIFDAHIHYSHDTWDALPPKAAIKILREAGLKRALVSMIWFEVRRPPMLECRLVSGG